MQTPTAQLAIVELGAINQFSGYIAITFFMIGLVTVMFLFMVGLSTVVKKMRAKSI